jgi:hypothetical protein
VKTHHVIALAGFLAVNFAAHDAKADDPKSDPKPVYEINIKAFDGSLTIDPKLKAFPALYERLLAAGKREIAKARSSAEAQRKTDPELFTDGKQFSDYRTYAVRAQAAHYVSIVRNISTYEGGAHPNPGIDTLLWDTQSGKMTNIRQFFTEFADNGPTLTTLTRKIRLAMVAAKKKNGIDDVDPDKDEWLSSIKPQITNIGGIALAPSTEAGKSSGFIAYFGPYVAGSYAEGTYSVFIPWTEFQGQLSPAGAAVFGGARPAGDEEND